MFLVVQSDDSLLIEGVDDRRLDRCIERSLGVGFEHGFVHQSFVVQPFGMTGGRR